MSHTGNCLCGAVAYSFEGEPLSVGLCHCRDCQRASGTLFQHAIVIRRSQLSLEGDFASFEVEGGKDKITRKFCPKCGSGVLMEPHVAPKVAIIEGGTLDDPSAFKPAREVFTAGKPSWLHTVEGIPAFGRGPEYS